MKNKFRAGFTLLEMLTVVIIIGILTSLALPQYRRAIQKARYTEAINMLRVIYDSGERLAATLGYRDYNALLAAEPARAGFNRMDMFDTNTMRACRVTEDNFGLICRNFEYRLNENRIRATRAPGASDAHTELFFYRTDVPYLTCTPGGRSLAICDAINLPVEKGEDTGIPLPGSSGKEKELGELKESTSLKEVTTAEQSSAFEESAAVLKKDFAVFEVAK